MYSKLKMKLLKNINKTFLYLLVIINLTSDFSYVIGQNTSRYNNPITLVLTQNTKVSNAITFRQAIHTSTPTIKKPDFSPLIKNTQILAQLKYRTQNQLTLDFKTTRLQIVLNDISIQKNHCI